jgi:hypothetical protein
VARVHLKPIASCKNLARLKSITAAYHGTSIDAPVASLAVSKSQHSLNETDLEMEQTNIDIVMDLEDLNFGISFDSDTDSDATRSYCVATASDLC